MAITKFTQIMGINLCLSLGVPYSPYGTQDNFLASRFRAVQFYHDVTNDKSGVLWYGLWMPFCIAIATGLSNRGVG